MSTIATAMFDGMFRTPMTTSTTITARNARLVKCSGIASVRNQAIGA
jgi:hypothetical protein